MSTVDELLAADAAPKDYLDSWHRFVASLSKKGLVSTETLMSIWGMPILVVPGAEPDTVIIVDKRNLDEAAKAFLHYNRLRTLPLEFGAKIELPSHRYFAMPTSAAI